MKKYLVIGGAGFIGTNFTLKLLSLGNAVTILDNFSRKGSVSNSEWLKLQYPNLNIIKADIRTDLSILSEEVGKVDVVYHLAGQVAVTTSVTNPREDFEINAMGTFNVLESIRNSSNKPIIIYASTNKVYGGMDDIKIIDRNNRYEYLDLPSGIKENRLLDFHSPYGCSKGCGDQYVRDYARIYGLKTVVMRQSCIYGPRQFGVEDQGWVAWFTIATLLDKPLTIYGNGKQIRDILHVDDLFRAWNLATEKISESSGKIFNIGGGSTNTLSLLELMANLEKLMEKKISPSYSDWRPGDQPVYVSDISKAKEELGWEPEINVEKGVELLYNWINENKNLFI